ncbi:MAG: phosphoglucosamine mutase, partial [Firmicutes bacterium]|nr:phosphoglucosamine mutase [Bacillota bacterium]
RYVLAKMQEVGANLGGEQSGHIIFLDYATTGDGLLSALQLLQVAASSRQRLAELAAIVKPFPQVLHNVPVACRDVINSPRIQQAIKEAEQLLAGRGRLLVRPSGTEPLIRVMAEAETEALAEKAARLVASVIQETQ